MKDIKHEHMIIRATVKQPPMTEEVIQEWVKTLITKIGMNLLKGPISSYVDMPGNRGVTCVAIIETSHIAVHVWDETDPALMQIDVYSCASLDVNIVFEHLKEFETMSLDYKFLNREFEIAEVDNV